MMVRRFDMSVTTRLIDTSRQHILPRNT